MRVSQLLTQLESLNNETEAACERLDAAQAERDAGEFAAMAMSRIRGHRPAAFRPTAGGSIRMSAEVVDAAMEDDADFDTTVEGLATLPVVIAKALDDADSRLLTAKTGALREASSIGSGGGGDGGGTSTAATGFMSVIAANRGNSLGAGFSSAGSNTAV